MAGERPKESAEMRGSQNCYRSCYRLTKINFLGKFMSPMQYIKKKKKNVLPKKKKTALLLDLKVELLFFW